MTGVYEFCFNGDNFIVPPAYTVLFPTSNPKHGIHRVIVHYSDVRKERLVQEFIRDCVDGIYVTLAGKHKRGPTLNPKEFNTYQEEAQQELAEGEKEMKEYLDGE